VSATRVAAIVLAAVGAAACHRQRPVTVTPDMPFALTLGRAARTPDGVGVRYLALLDDSRCPPGVECVWAGTVRVAVAITGPSHRETRDTLDLARKGRSVPVGGFVVRFVEFQPPPVRPGAPRTDPARTEATFVIERAGP